MEKTYLNYFNFYLKQFLNEIISYFPYTKNQILLNYRQLLEEKDNKDDLWEYCVADSGIDKFKLTPFHGKA